MSAMELAGMLYDSLHEKLLTLPERHIGVPGSWGWIDVRKKS